MTRCRSPRSPARPLAAGLLAGLLLVGTTGPAAAAEEPRPLFAFADPEISESSGLVDAGDVVYTVNDSGAGPVLYAVDARSGETSGRTVFADGDVEDVEALAPGRGGTVWVGDIGDNRAARDHVSLYRVRPGVAGPAPRLDVTYPDGPRDAEALLTHPRTGRLFVVSKTVFGGAVYAVPSGARPTVEPGRTVTMRRFARVPGLVTDGAFLPDGRHVLLRGYAAATVLTFPGFEVRGSFDLPEQRQGEAVSVSRSGRVLVSTEGVGTDVLRVEVPRRLTAPVATPAASPTASPAASGAASPTASPVGGAQETDRDRPGRGPWARGLRLGAGLVLLGALGLSLRRLWREDRR